MSIGDKVTTTSDDHLALDYHGLQGVIGDEKIEPKTFANRRHRDYQMFWVDFCGEEYERRVAEHQGARRLVPGLWIPREALTKRLI